MLKELAKGSCHFYDAEGGKDLLASIFYQGKTVRQAEKELIDWLDANKENAIITINFHNNFFDDMLYAGYEQLYEVLLKYFLEEKWDCMTQSSLLSEFYRPELYRS